ncbi:prolyl oligopeptidase family-domain-containing protein [Syncephalis fuscata]|nr:prolyl oligopeptidase family-domain-containing protein [Syncephalis fuscata]
MLLDPAFDAPIVSLMDQSFAHAIGHVRGGGELGDAWYPVANKLFNDGYLRKELLAIESGSTGGLLIVAAINQQPNIANVAIADSICRCFKYIINPFIPATVEKYSEWGNPNILPYFAIIRDYSPYDNIQENINYPNLLGRVGLNGSRVQYWEPTKWVAKLQAKNVTGDECNLNPHIIIQLTNIISGHFNCL